MIRNFHGDHPSDEDLTRRCEKAGVGPFQKIGQAVKKSRDPQDL